MRRILTVLGVLVLTSSVSLAGGSFGVFGTYWDTEDFDAGYGGGIKFKADVVDYVAAEIRGSGVAYFNTDDAADEDFRVFPVEADILLNAPVGEMLTLYIGPGIGYYVMPEYESKEKSGASKEPDIDPEDTWGYYGVAGLEIALAENIAIFAEAKYTVVEIEKVAIDGKDYDIGDDPAELTGVAGNVGVLFTW